MRIHLLSLAVSSILAQNAAALPMCEPARLDSQFNLAVPCVFYNGNALSAQLQFSGDLAAQRFQWRLEEAGAAACRPHLAACARVSRAGNVELPVRVGDTDFRAELGGDLSLRGAQAPSLAPGSMAVAESLGSVAFKTGKTLPLSVGIGSGAFHMPGDPPEVIYTITDRGPNIGCDETEALLGDANFCMDNGVLDAAGKVFPIPAFTPSIYKIKLDPANGQYQVLEIIALKDSAGNPISGISNPLGSVSTTENSYAPQANKLPYQSAGLDPEALVRLSDGSFWIGEEYGSSLVHVAADGTVLKRVVPAGVETALQDAGYPVVGMLPEIWKQRQLNRGIESIALSPDEKYLYTLMQSPLANPDADAYKSSRNVRLLKLSLENGDIKAVVGEYVYSMDRPEVYIADQSVKQNDVKISEMIALDTDLLIVLERITKHTRLYRVKLDQAANILGTEWDRLATTPSLENTALRGSAVMPVTKELVMDSLRDLPNAKAKIESVALLDGKHVALINDNDFGVAGDTTSIVVAPLYRQVLSGGDSAELKLSRIGRFQNPNAEYDVGAAEIVAYDTASKRAFVINAQAKTVDVLNLSDPANPAKAGVIDVAQALPNAGGINSVSVKNGIVAVAVENSDKQAKGWAAFYAADSLGLYGSVEVGSLPDMITFTPDGSKVLVANEGEPNDDYSNDPEGTVSLIDVATQTVKTVDFSAFNGHEAALRQHGVRIFGKNATAAQDFEPEYIAVSADGQEAYVSLQENNAVAVIDVAQGNLKNLLPLGYKDHSQAGNELDSSDRDSKISFRNAPVWGMYLPDSIAAYKVNGMNYFVTANEGDSRDYTGYSEEERVKNVTLDPAVFPNAAELQADARLGRLKITTSMGDTDNDGDYDKLYAYGARSFSIWNANGEQVFDSGNQLEAITTNALGKNFNSDAEVDDNGNLQPGGDGRSDDKGPEPEALAIGEAYGQTYAFIGLERVGGVMVYNISNPRQPRFVQYFNDIEYGKPALQAGDLAPEGMAFIPAAASPNGKPLLLVGNEVSGTTAIYQLDTME